MCYTQDNQRPPVYNAEDYIQSLKKYSSRRGASSGGANANKSIYDTSDTADHSGKPSATAAAPATSGSTSSAKDEKRAASTLPTKHSDYK